MPNRQLVLVAIDHAADVKRAIDVARGAARSRGGNVDVIHVVGHRAVRFDDRPGVRTHERHDDSVTMRIASVLRSGAEDGVHVRSVTLRGTPEHVIFGVQPATSSDAAGGST